MPLVIAGSKSASVFAPRGTIGSIVTRAGARGSVERAVEEGLADPFESGVPGARIPLAEGTRVSLTLPSRATGTAYRAAPEHLAATAPLVIEVSLVSGGRAPGRFPSTRGRGLLAASTSLAAAAVATWLGLGAASSLPPGVEEDEPSRDTLLALQALMPAPPEDEVDHAWDEPYQDRWGGMIGTLLPPGNDSDFCAFVPDPALGEHRRLVCGPRQRWGDDEGRQEALPGELSDDDGGPPGSPGLPQGFGLGYGRRGARAKPPRVRMGVPEVSPGLPRELVQRIARQSFGRLRWCYERGLQRNPNLQGDVTLRFVIGKDGIASNLTSLGARLPDGFVVSCVKRAFDGVSFSRPPHYVRVAYPISFTPGG